MAVPNSTDGGMVLRNGVILLLLVMVASCGSGTTEPVKSATPLEESEPMGLEESKDIFVLQCASCHGMDGKLGSSGAADLSVSKMDDAAILKTILDGNDKGMMPYRDILSPREADGLVVFVKTLRK